MLIPVTLLECKLIHDYETELYNTGRQLSYLYLISHCPVFIAFDSAILYVYV